MKTKNCRTILVEVWFLDSVRKHPPGKGYRPHFVVKGTDTYLGVEFEALPIAPSAEQLICRVKLIYEIMKKGKGVDYSMLLPNIQFDIKEGPNTVGEGIVLEV